MSKTITLKRGKEDSLLRFHPWVFSGAIANLPEGLEEGDTVSVVAADGRPLGTGHYEIGSIAVRMLSWDNEADIDASFFATRLAAAWQLRERLGL
ncbi:MAG: class I SAM-dependent rRNA methyltransferase, partial [Duncaniella sp.]|nr:class I SAM-dependent rRNA methyltransferase [Duncaniella sp.]